MNAPNPKPPTGWYAVLEAFIILFGIAMLAMIGYTLFDMMSALTR